MSNDLTKFKQLYKIVFKNEQDEDKTINEDSLAYVKAQWIAWKPVEIAWELFNPFEIRKIVKWTLEDWVISRLNCEPQAIRDKVKEMMRLYKKKISLWVLENMIKKAKWIDI